MPPGESIFAEKPAKRLKRDADISPAAEIDPEEAWSLVDRQPWADKEVAPAVLNEEQKAYLDQIAKEKAEKEAEEAGEGKKVTPKPSILYIKSRVLCMRISFRWTCMITLSQSLDMCSCMTYIILSTIISPY